MVADGRATAGFQLRMIRVAAWLGWVSIALLVGATLLPHVHHGHMFHGSVWLLAAAGAFANTVLAILPWGRWVGTERAELILTGWGAGVILLIAVVVRASGGWTSDAYLLYFLVIPFVAATEPLRRQLLLYAVVVVGYLAAVTTVPVPALVGHLLLRVGTLLASCAVGAMLARIVEDTIRSRARAEADARLERLLVDEAHHRIKNQLQLVSDLLELEARKPGVDTSAVVSETVARIQSVAAVHQALARQPAGRVRLLPVIQQVTRTTADRLAAGRAVWVDGDDVVLRGERATWAALVANELLANALRHGRGVVAVTLRGNGGQMVLSVRDEGHGPAGRPDGLGWQLVRRLAEDGLGGEVATALTACGWTASVAFPLDEDPELARACTDR